MHTLRDRCKAIASKLQRDAMLRQGNPVDTLLEFVVRKAKPNMIMKKMP